VTHDLLLRHVEVDERDVDVHVTGTTIVAVGPGLRPGGDPEVVDGHGGALLPGLHDHHIHLLATAAARSSVAVGPGEVDGAAGLAAALGAADAALPAGRWLRAVGYHESVAGDLDRWVLDALVPDRPLRIQHRSGARWTLNTAAVAAVGLDGDAPSGAERDDHGRLTGRLHRSDAWLRERLPAGARPDLAELGTALARVGVTGVTDATPFGRPADLTALAAATTTGALPLRVVAMGGPELAGAEFPAALGRGPVKLVIDDARYPALDDLVAAMSHAHRQHRPVAVHCVTRTALALALAAWESAGARAGDRIEHGSVVPPDAVASIAALGLTVVTQPGFVAERGDQYLADVAPDDIPHLYPCRRLIDAGVAVAGSTDAPYSAIDPWAAMRAAVHRTTAAGAEIAPAEAVAPQRALQLFLGPADRPGGPPRTVAPGAPADLCLLDRPLADVLRRLTGDDVVRTVVRTVRG